MRKFNTIQWHLRHLLQWLLPKLPSLSTKLYGRIYRLAGSGWTECNANGSVGNEVEMEPAPMPENNG